MSKPKLLNLDSFYISSYLTRYHSQSLYKGHIKEYDFVSRHNELAIEPEKFG